MTHLVAASLIRYAAVWVPIVGFAIWLCTSPKGPKK